MAGGAHLTHQRDEDDPNVTAHGFRLFLAHVQRASYDETQVNAVLTTCTRCGRSYYMTHAQAWCAECRR